MKPNHEQGEIDHLASGAECVAPSRRHPAPDVNTWRCSRVCDSMHRGAGCHSPRRARGSLLPGLLRLPGPQARVKAAGQLRAHARRRGEAGRLGRALSASASRVLRV